MKKILLSASIVAASLAFVANSASAGTVIVQNQVPAATYNKFIKSMSSDTLKQLSFALSLNDSQHKINLTAPYTDNNVNMSQSYLPTIQAESQKGWTYNFACKQDQGKSLASLYPNKTTIHVTVESIDTKDYNPNLNMGFATCVVTAK